MHATVELIWELVSERSWHLYHLGHPLAIVHIYHHIPNSCTIALGDEVYSFDFNGEFDQEWREQLLAIVAEDLLSS